MYKIKGEKMPAMISAHIIVNGRVQGVGFRYFVQRHANRLGLTGFVRNVQHGSSVEIIVEGEKRNLETIIELITKGPELAKVTGIDIQWSDSSNLFTSFEVRY